MGLETTSIISSFSVIANLTSDPSKYFMLLEIRFSTALSSICRFALIARQLALIEGLCFVKLRWNMRHDACLSGMRQGAMFSSKARFRYAEARNGA